MRILEVAIVSLQVQGVGKALDDDDEKSIIRQKTARLNYWLSRRTRSSTKSTIQFEISFALLPRQ
jgi:hypothetical protein